MKIARPEEAGGSSKPNDGKTLVVQCKAGMMWTAAAALVVGLAAGGPPRQDKNPSRRCPSGLEGLRSEAVKQSRGCGVHVAGRSANERSDTVKPSETGDENSELSSAPTLVRGAKSD